MVRIYKRRRRLRKSDKMEEAIKAYRHVTATDEFKEIERLRSRARHNEASALGNARREARAKGKAEGRREGRREGKAEGRREGEQIGEKRADKKWQDVVAEKDALIAELQARLGKDT